MSAPALAAALPGLSAASNHPTPGAAPRDPAGASAAGAFARELQHQQQAHGPTPPLPASTASPALAQTPSKAPAPKAGPAASASAAPSAPTAGAGAKPASTPDRSDPADTASGPDAPPANADAANPTAAARRQAGARLRALRPGVERPAELAHAKAAAALQQADDATALADPKARRRATPASDEALSPGPPPLPAPTVPAAAAPASAMASDPLTAQAAIDAAAAKPADAALETAGDDPAGTETAAAAAEAAEAATTTERPAELSAGASASPTSRPPASADGRAPSTAAPADTAMPAARAAGAARAGPTAAAARATVEAAPATRLPAERSRPAMGEAPIAMAADTRRDAPVAASPPAPSGRDDAPGLALQTPAAPLNSTAGAPTVPSATSFASELLRAQAAADPARSNAPAPAPAELQLSTPVTAPDFVPRLSGELAVLARDGVQEARVQVHPVELGPISVQISLDGTAAQVHLAVDSAQTRELLEQAMPALAAALRENGLTLTGGGVFQQARQQARQDAPGPGDGSRNSGSGGREIGAVAAPATASRATRHAGVVDLYA